MEQDRKTRKAAAGSAAEGAPPRQRAATIRHVAEAAGVSTATVSKFINGGQRFTREVEARIERAIQELGYSSNPMARSMITGRTGNVGIVILDIRNPHFTSLVKGASRVAAETGLNLLFADAAESREPELAVLQALSRRVDGLIVSARLPEPVVEWLHKSGKPVVFFGGPPSKEGFHSVGCDNHQSAFMLGKHLRDLGHRRISFVGFSAARWSGERWRGLQDAFAGAEDCTLRLFDVAAPSSEEGERVASSVLLNGDGCDAVVAFNDLIALGLLNEARAMGIQVPRQMSIAGFDNITYGRYVTPTLTSVDTASEGTGEVAMRLLVRIIASDPSVLPSHETLPSRVVVRDSTAAREGAAARPAASRARSVTRSGNP
jgi:LacI family transcriptional regulator